MVDQSQIDFLRSIGKCASIAPNHMGSFVCTMSCNHVGRDHKAQVMGGPEDGKTLATWPW